MKKKQSIWVNCLVKNEERWLWFGINSVLPYVDKILVWDSGSTDKTKEIINSIKNNKIEFKEIGEVSKEKFGHIRQQMLGLTFGDWVFILDGDEIWPKVSLTSLIDEINNADPKIEGLSVRPINFVGDINYIHPETFSNQTPHAPIGLKGFFSTRVFRRAIKGLHAANSYGKESFYDADNLTLREKPNRIKYLDKIYYWHMSYLPRSSSETDQKVMMRAKKRKYEIGIKRPEWIGIPEVFNLPRPENVQNPYYQMSDVDYWRSVMQTPLKKLVRRLF
jgi:glycosyltransferase involved in cell wall biosynthesis